MAPADTRHRAKRHPDHGTVMAPADNTRHRAERRAAQGGAPTHEVRFHPIANWQQGQKVAIIGGGRYHTLDNLTAWNTSEDAKSVIDKACARGTRQLSEVPDSQASIDMGPSPPNATRALLASPHIGIVALSPPEEQLRDSIITTPHTQDRSSCLACHNLHTGKTKISHATTPCRTSPLGRSQQPEGFRRRGKQQFTERNEPSKNT
ncbi:hypothetical protein EV426DRAFT_286432 [Tirmania nivea]|nr:hypothetical protein EV426DRAFT_286432 [Tirmania nivea]